MDGTYGEDGPSQGTRSKSGVSTRASGNLPTESLQQVPLLQRLSGVMPNILSDGKGNYYVISCSECGANYSSRNNGYFSLAGLQHHYRMSHGRQHDTEDISQFSSKILLTDQDIADILAGRVPDKDGFGRRAHKAEKRLSKSNRHSAGETSM